MRQTLWLLLFLLALCSLGAGILWKQSIEFQGQVFTETQYGFRQQPNCWGCIAVQNPKLGEELEADEGKSGQENPPEAENPPETVPHDPERKNGEEVDGAHRRGWDS